MDAKPKYTSSSNILQPLVKIDRRDDVASVSGRHRDTYRNTTGMPSIGQITPDSNSVG